MNFNMDFTAKGFTLIASSFALMVVGLVLYLFVFSGPTSNSPIGQLALCLSDQGATMYSLPTCPHCQEQKDIFGDSFRYVDYVNCSENREKCINEGIETVPTWIIDKKKFAGVQELGELAEKAGCQYP